MTPVKDKIAALQRLADSTTFPEERANALRRIEALKAKHSIEEPRPAFARGFTVNVRPATAEERAKMPIGEWLEEVSRMTGKSPPDIEEIFKAAMRRAMP